MLDERQILNIVGQELSQSAGGNENDFIDSNRQAALATYLGQSTEKVPDGKSSVVSTDVADAIEWIMPEIVKAFTQNNEVVTFDPVGANDELQAELESQYVYDILMKDNNGFLVIHQFVKDALMQKNGFIKVFYSKETEVVTEHYTGITEPEYMVVAGDKSIEILEESMEMDPTGKIPVFNIKVSRTLEEGKVNVISVPPEEFRVNKMHNSVDLSTARFTAHVLLKTRSDLVQEGYDPEVVAELTTSYDFDDDRDYRFYMQDETVIPNRDSPVDDSLGMIEIAECYMQMDLNEDGIAEMVKVTVAGGDEPDVILDIEEVDEIPFISATAILMSHKLFGLSIYDRLKEIQEQKTTLWRNILDNMYLQNNQRTIVIDGQVNLDDLMISRPGGIIRAKRPDAVVPFPTTQLSADSYKMMDYLDQVRTGRAGVSPEGAITDNMIGDRVGSEGVDQMMSQKEELVGLMVRVIAETGIKPLCYMIRRNVVKHQDVAKEYMFKNMWIKVDPRSWRQKRANTTVRVGTGSGNRKSQMQTLSALKQIQAEAAMKPGQVLVTPKEEYKLIDDFAKLGGLGGAGMYFLDPQSPQGQQHAQMVGRQMEQEKQKQDMKDQGIMKLQTDLAKAELGKVSVQQENGQLKAQIDAQKNSLAASKQEDDQYISYLKQQLDEAKALVDAGGKNAELEFKYWDRETFYRVERERIAATEKAAAENNDASE